MEQAKHTMTIAQTYPSGAEEWVCPTCGLRFIMQWPPHYKKIILDEGDPTAIHSGGKGGLTMGEAEIGPAENSGEDDIELTDAERRRLIGLDDFLRGLK